MKNVTDQAKQRYNHLPHGMKDNQKINIDLAGQKIDETTERRIRNKIVEKSGGIIKPENIIFRE